MKTVIKTAAVVLALTGTLTTSCEKPDVIVNKGFDAELFRKNILASTQDKTTGFSFTITQNGKIVKYDKGGVARTGIDGERAYDINTRQGIGSCSKTITALAVLRALEAKEKNEGAFLVDLLPASWKIPAANKPLTVKLLLQHKAGLTKFGGSFAAIRQTMQTPTTGYGDDAYAYDNLNYTVCRALLFCILNDPKELDGLSDEAADEVISTFYRNYVRSNIFQLSEVPTAQQINIGPWNNAGSISPKSPDRTMTLYYNVKQPALEGIMRYTTYLEGGPGGWYMSSPEVASVLAAAEQGKLVSTGMMKRMKELFMGFDNVRKGDHGNYYFKNGVYWDAQDRGIYTVVMHFPNNVQVAWHSNSRTHTITGGPETMLKNAYDNAWH